MSKIDADIDAKNGKKVTITIDDGKPIAPADEAKGSEGAGAAATTEFRIVNADGKILTITVAE
jgi:hypothetical protein